MVLAMGACLFPSLDTLTGDAGDAGDAGVAAEGGSDAVVDVASNDGGSTDSGASDAFFCDSVDASFCADFEQVPSLTNFTTTILNGVATIVADDAGPSVSPPNALHVVIPQSDGGGNNASVAWTAPNQVSDMEYTFDVLVLSVSSSATHIGSVQFGPFSNRYSVILNVTNYTLGVFEQLPTDAGFTSFTHAANVALLAAPTWNHVVLTITQAGNTAFSTLTVNQALVEDAGLIPEAQPYITTKAPIFNTGASFAPSATSDRELRFDDLIVRVR